MQSLRSVLDSYTLSRDLEPASAQQLRLTLDRYERWLGTAGTVLDLTDDSANRWILSMQSEGLARTTIRGQRGNLLTLWRYACEELDYATWPRRVRKIRAPVPLPEAWSELQMRDLLASVEKLTGRFPRSRVLRRAFWRAFVLTAWDSGLRLGDLLSLEFAQVGSGGAVSVRQKKTGWPILCRLRPETVAAIHATAPPERARVFGDALSRGHVLRQFAALAKSAGLTGGTKRIRRGSATAVERILPGAAMSQLGHRTPGLAAKHYIDPRLLADDRPRPPALA